MTTILKTVLNQGVYAFTRYPGFKVGFLEPQLLPESIPDYVPALEPFKVPPGAFVCVMPEKDFLKRQDAKGEHETKGEEGRLYYLPQSSSWKGAFLQRENCRFYLPLACAESVRQLALEIQNDLNRGLLPVFCLPGKSHFPQRSSKAEFIASAALIKLAALAAGCGLRPVREDGHSHVPKMLNYSINLHQTVGWEPDRFAHLVSGYLSLLKTRKKPDFYRKWDSVIHNLINPVIVSTAAKECRDLQNEIECVPAERKLFIQGEFLVLVTTQSLTPGVMDEIGRLREISFREVGEGTGKESDLDKFDAYYEHLILWDLRACQIAGSYRLGYGDEILKTRGIRGFYTRELFYYEPGFEKILSKTIELGRSFIVKEYRGKRLPLFLLWKGIYRVLAQKKELRYLMGAASISNSYSACSRKIMVDYLQEHFEDEYISSFVSPALPCKLKLNKKQRLAARFHRDFVHENPEDLVKSIDPATGGFPVLIKRYLQQNARVLGVNIDVNFADSIDVLMLLDRENIPGQTRENFKQCKK